MHHFDYDTLITYRLIPFSPSCPTDSEKPGIFNGKFYCIWIAERKIEVSHTVVCYSWLALSFKKKTKKHSIAFLQWNIRSCLNSWYYISCHYGRVESEKQEGLYAWAHRIWLIYADIILSRYWFSLLLRNPMQGDCFFYVFFLISLCFFSYSLSSYCNASLMRWVVVLCAFASKVSPNGPESLYFVS